jgi:hypothetical protein
MNCVIWKSSRYTIFELNICIRPRCMKNIQMRVLAGSRPHFCQQTIEIIASFGICKLIRKLIWRYMLANDTRQLTKFIGCLLFIKIKIAPPIIPSYQLGILAGISSLLVFARPTTTIYLSKLSELLPLSLLLHQLSSSIKKAVDLVLGVVTGLLNVGDRQALNQAH